MAAAHAAMSGPTAWAGCAPDLEACLESYAPLAERQAALHAAPSATTVSVRSSCGCSSTIRSTAT